MAEKKFYDLIWIEPIEGKDKPIFRKCGMVMIKEDGKIAVKVDVIPTHNFTGWFWTKERQEKEGLASQTELGKDYDATIRYRSGITADKEPF